MAASWMAILHNGLRRGLNTIYLQAPHVQPGDYDDFHTLLHPLEPNRNLAPPWR